jgi:hypothetical protein
VTAFVSPEVEEHFRSHSDADECTSGQAGEARAIQPWQVGLATQLKRRPREPVGGEEVIGLAEDRQAGTVNAQEQQLRGVDRSRLVGFPLAREGGPLGAAVSIAHQVDHDIREPLLLECGAAHETSQARDIEQLTIVNEPIEYLIEQSRVEASHLERCQEHGFGIEDGAAATPCPGYSQVRPLCPKEFEQ